MTIVISILHIVIAVALIGLILLQSSKGGLRTGIGGDFYRSKRGAEKLVFTSTIILSALFLLTSILNVILK